MAGKASTQTATKKAATSKTPTGPLPSDADAPGNAEVQAKADAEAEQGYRGVAPDPTPNENYTVGGVTSGKPTPETTRTGL